MKIKIQNLRKVHPKVGAVLTKLTDWAPGTEAQNNCWVPGEEENFNSWDGGMLQKVGGATALKMAYITYIYIYIQAFKTSKVHQARLSLH